MSFDRDGDDIPDECEPPFLVSSTPEDGAIDPLGEHDGTGTPRMSQITLAFSQRVRNQDGSPLGASAFTLTATDNPLIPGTPVVPGVASVDASGNPIVVVTLSEPIPVGEWTTLAAAVQSMGGLNADLHVAVAHLPCDVNEDGVVTLSDGSRFGQLWNGAQPLKLLDVNRDGQININDATMFGQLWSGTSGFLKWLGKGLPAEPTH